MEQPFRAARLPRMMELLGVSRSTVYNLERDDPSFPRRRRISNRAVAWNELEVLEWLEARPEAGKSAAAAAMQAVAAELAAANRPLSTVAREARCQEIARRVVANRKAR